jgi:hypothetical protein
MQKHSSAWSRIHCPEEKEMSIEPEASSWYLSFLGCLLGGHGWDASIDSLGW